MPCINQSINNYENQVWFLHQFLHDIFQIWFTVPGHWGSFRSDGISSRLWQPSDTWPSRSLNVHKFNKVIPSQATQSYQLQKQKQKKVLLWRLTTISNEGPTMPKWTPNIAKLWTCNLGAKSLCSCLLKQWGLWPIFIEQKSFSIYNMIFASPVCFSINQYFSISLQVILF